MDLIDEMLNSSSNFFLTGSGGCGKSYLIKELKSKSDDGMLITASTGIAAINVEGCTLHRALGLRLFKGTVDSLEAQMRKREGLMKKWRSIHTLVIDEISMFDIGTFVRASQLMSRIRSNKRPWGGIKVILGGDMLQLPVIKKYKEDGITYSYLFEHPVWQEMDIQVRVLDTPYRYVSRDFFDTLSDVRYGVLSDRVKDLIKQCTRKPEKHPSGIIPTVVFSHNADVDGYNNEKLARLPGEEHEYIATFVSTFNGERIETTKERKDSILDHTRVSEVLRLKINCQVLLMVNTIHDNLANGSRGVVIGFDDNNVPLVRFMNGLELPIPLNTWDEGHPREIHGRLEWENHRVTQIPLRLGYSVSAHRCQGLTLDTAYLSLSRAFCPGHLYIMMSRCRDPQHMYLSGFDEKIWHKCRPDPSVVQFYRDLEK